MLKGTKIALKKSIRKWEKIVARKGPDLGGRNCALCERFHDNCTRTRADNSILETCPVTIAAKDAGCTDTPYDPWSDYFSKLGSLEPAVVYDDTSRDLAKAELAFLKSLLPEAPAND